MRAVVLVVATTLLALLLGACGRGPASSLSPSGAAALPNCSLPVYNWGWTTNGNVSSVAGQTGFISLPSGTFKPDPTASSGGGGSTYVRAYRRWLPVPAAQVLADGSAYVYEQQLADGPYEIHVVQVANGADKMIYHMPYDNAYSVLALEPEGVYVVPIIHKSGVPSGLWLLSSTAPTLMAVPGAIAEPWQVIAGGAAWGGPVGEDRLDRLDLSTGVVTTWFRHAVFVPPGIGSTYGVSVVGFDRSLRPLVEVYPPIDTAASPARTTPVAEVWLASGQGVDIKLAGMPLPDQGDLQVGVTDSHGTWFVGADGVYLYTDAGFQRVALLPPAAGPAPNYTVAGDCG